MSLVDETPAGDQSKNEKVVEENIDEEATIQKNIEEIANLMSEEQDSDKESLKIAEAEEEEPAKEPVKEEILQPIIHPNEFEEAQKTLIPSLPETKTEETEEKPDLALTLGVTISNDATTAAVLDEIAQEKSHVIETKNEEEKLFEELENNFQKDNESEELPQENIEDSITENTEETKEESKEGTSEVLQGKDIQENKEEKQEEETKETPKETTEQIEVSLETKIQDETISGGDEFLKTFATNVEEVFLDQPTAIISDYVPPSENKEEAPLENIKRVKPSDIKTVPLVPEVMGEEIHSSPYVESATAQVRKGNAVTAVIKVILVLALVGGLSLAIIMWAAISGWIPEKYSPLNKIMYLLQKSPQEKQVSYEDEMDPESMAQDMPLVTMEETVAEEQQDPNESILATLKAYAFSDGTTLEERIKSANKNVEGDFEWTLFPTEEKDVYSLAVKFPPNKEGQSFSYRFNYNVSNSELTPTTSEAKNIMENFNK